MRVVKGQGKSTNSRLRLNLLRMMMAQNELIVSLSLLLLNVVVSTLRCDAVYTL